MTRVLTMVITLGVLCATAPAMAQGKGGGWKDNRRAFYLTEEPFDGSQALNACAPGFHMASIFEIADVANLKYDATLGTISQDAGAGPPALRSGWVRTGVDATLDNIAGQANCSRWTNGAFGRGTVAFISSLSSVVPPISPWVALTSACDNLNRVGCVQD